MGEFEILLFRRGPGAVFQYSAETLELIETTGKHAATIHTPWITIETNNGGTTERDCASEAVRIAAGGRVNLPAALGYCEPYAIVGTEAAQVTISAVFVDDNSRTGTVRITKSVAGCTLAGGFGSVSCRTDAR